MPKEKSPTRDEIIANIRMQNSGHLIEQIINLEADKIVLANEISRLVRKIKEFEERIGGANVNFESYNDC